MFRSISKKLLLSTLFLTYFFSAVIPSTAQAQLLTCSGTTDKGRQIRYSFEKDIPNAATSGVLFEDSLITATLFYGSTSATNLKVTVVQEEVQALYGYWFEPESQRDMGDGTVKVVWNAGKTDNGRYHLELWGDLNGTRQLLCTAKSVFEVTNTGAVPLPASCGSFSVTPTSITDATQGLAFSFNTDDVPQANNSVRFKFFGANGFERISENYRKGQGVVSDNFSTFNIGWLRDVAGGKEGVVAIEQFYGASTWKVVCQKLISYDNTNNSGEIGETSDGSTSITPPQAFALCKQAGSVNDDKCQECFDKEGIWTAVGCIPYSNTAQTVRALLTIGLGLAGTVVVLMTLAGAFMLSTSRGEPQRVEEAKSLIVSAVSGILFLIFSVTILRFIGVSIFQLPGFG